MGKRVDPAQYDAIRQALSGAGEGRTLEELAALAGLDLPHRTLQRRLRHLIDAGDVAQKGRGKATRYLLAASRRSDTQQHKDGQRPGGTGLSPTLELSDDAQEIWAAVARPVAQRPSVSYRREFLDAYVPNETFYLPQGLREELAETGRSDMGAQPAGTYARRILDRLLIDLSFNSSRLEGNTYSVLDTKRLIEFGRSAEGADPQETQMILNHKEAIEFLVRPQDRLALDRRTIQNLHALLSDNLLGDPSQSGRLRQSAVGIGSSAYIPLAVPQLIEECFAQLVATAAEIENPFEQAFFFLVQLPYLQPFIDVNKRVSRLAANIPLIRDNLRPLSFTDVPQDDYIAGLLGVYELNRIELLRDVFAWAYRRSAEQYAAIRDSLGEPDQFRLAYRRQIKQAVSEIVIGKVSPDKVERFVANWSQEQIEKRDQARFAAVIEAELVGLHEGNYARYRVTPAQFDQWRNMDGEPR